MLFRSHFAVHLGAALLDASAFCNEIHEVRASGMSARLQLAKLFYRRGNFEESRIYLADALRMMEPPTADALWLGLRLERKLGNRAAEGGYASQLRGRYPTSPEYQEFLKGNFE